MQCMKTSVLKEIYGRQQIIIAGSPYHGDKPYDAGDLSHLIFLTEMTMLLVHMCRSFRVCCSA